MGAKAGKRVTVTPYDRAMLDRVRDKIGIDEMLVKVRHRTRMDKRTLEKIIQGGKTGIKSSTDIPVLRKVFRFASPDPPLAQDEQELIVAYRRLKQAQPDAGPAFLRLASDRAERAEEVAEEELRIAEKRRQLTE